ncbi:MAG: hypothetical protein ACR2PZ_14900 [Pseudomonadales bacterium]
MTQSLLFPLLIAVGTGCALLGTVCYVHYRLLKLGEVVDRTAQQMEAFSEASIAVGDAVQAHMNRKGVGTVGTKAQAAGSSRRLLLQQARSLLEQGVPTEEVAQTCGLVQDEVRILNCLRGQKYSLQV